MNTLRPIAMYLPQFHPIPENDDWWGKGFTDWNNVVKSKPLFEEHYQPHLPADLGFYDLRLHETREAQAAMAKAYGIYGFCYYHYWFNGKQLLEQPFNEVLESGKPDFPFMLCWANENWTRRWDGKDEEILLAQKYSNEDDLAHIHTLLPCFKDPRYITINNKPVVAIYRSTLLPDAKRTIGLWRQEAAKEDIELYICRIENAEHHGKSYMEAGFDAAIDFQPHAKTLDEYKKIIDKHYKISTLHNRIALWYYTITGQSEKYDSHIRNILFSFQQHIRYNDYVDHLKTTYTYPAGYTMFPCAAPSWDNTARRGKSAFFFREASPSKFKDWLKFIKSTFQPSSPEENLVFINAWNEWAEGCHLEPDQKWGLDYLKAVKNVFNSSPEYIK